MLGRELIFPKDVDNRRFLKFGIFMTICRCLGGNGCKLRQ